MRPMKHENHIDALKMFTDEKVQKQNTFSVFLLTRCRIGFSSYVAPSHISKFNAYCPKFH